MIKSYTEQDILNYLDKAPQNPYGFFMDLDHGYFATANSRLSLFADQSRWAIVFEKSGYANRASRMEIELNYFGNCLHNVDRGGNVNQYECNAKWFELIEPDVLNKFCGEDGAVIIPSPV
jgi:hypothetical protein